MENKNTEFKIEVYIQEQESKCMEELQKVLDKYNCIVIPEILISPEGLKPNLKVKFIK